jgi:hypothetical protein
VTRLYDFYRVGPTMWDSFTTQERGNGIRASPRNDAAHLIESCAAIPGAQAVPTTKDACTTPDGKTITDSTSVDHGGATKSVTYSGAEDAATIPTEITQNIDLGRFVTPVVVVLAGHVRHLLTNQQCRHHHWPWHPHRPGRV